MSEHPTVDLSELEGTLPEATSEASEKKKTRKSKAPKEKRKSLRGDEGRKESGETQRDRLPTAGVTQKRGAGSIRKGSEDRFSADRFATPLRYEFQS